MANIKVILRKNEQGRYDALDVETKEVLTTLTAGNAVTLIAEDEDGALVTGNIEHNSSYGYYFTDNEGIVTYLYNGVKGLI